MFLELGGLAVARLPHFRVRSFQNPCKPHEAKRGKPFLV